jgi:hypothetical protein
VELRTDLNPEKSNDSALADAHTHRARGLHLLPRPRAGTHIS